jgi:hypothetical protein
MAEAKLMYQALCTGAVLLVLVVAATSIGDQPNAEQPGEPVLVNVSGPTVVGFWWSVTQSQSESDKDTIASLQSALKDVANCLKNEDVSIRMEIAHVFRLRSGGSEETIELPQYDFPGTVGAILARPGVHRQIVYGVVQHPKALSYALREHASEYFNAPACRPEQ